MLRPWSAVPRAHSCFLALGSAVPAAAELVPAAAELVPLARQLSWKECSWLEQAVADHPTLHGASCSLSDAAPTLLPYLQATRHRKRPAPTHSPPLTLASLHWPAPAPWPPLACQRGRHRARWARASWRSRCPQPARGCLRPDSASQKMARCQTC